MNVTFLVSIICLLFCCFIFFYFKWYIKRRISAAELLAEYRTEVYGLIAEINSVTDRDSQLVEDRIKTLKTLLDDTDKRIAVYVRELDRSRSGEALYASLGRGIRAALNTSGQQAAAPAAKETQGGLPATHAAAPPPPVQAPAPETSKQQIRAKIEAFADQGLSPVEIASRLDISLSEVDLALNLLGRDYEP